MAAFISSSADVPYLWIPQMVYVSDIKADELEAGGQKNTKAAGSDTGEKGSIEKGLVES